MFHHRNHLHHSVCDLTVANARAIGRSLVTHWKVDEEAHTGSDHVVIRYTIANQRVATGEMTKVRPNWKKADEESYTEAFRAVLDERKDNISSMMNQEQPTREQKMCKQWFYDLRRWCWSLCLRPGYMPQWEAVNKKGVCWGSCPIQMALLAGRGQEARQIGNTQVCVTKGIPLSSEVIFVYRLRPLLIPSFG